MTFKKSDLETLYRSLWAASAWEKSLADAWQPGSPERRAALKKVKEYESLRLKIAGRMQDSTER